MADDHNLLSLAPQTQALYARVGELEQALAKLTDELQTARSLLEQVRDGMAVSDPNNVIIYANPAFKTMSGYGEQVVGKTIADMYTPEVYERLLATLGPALFEHGAWQGTAEHLRPDGSTWTAHLSATLLLDPYGQLQGTFALFRDITAEQAQDKRLRLFEALADNALDAVLISSPDSQITYANRAYYALTGYDASVVGTNILDLFSDTPTYIEATRATLLANGSWTGTRQLRRRAGDSILTQAAIVCINDEQGQPLAIAGILRDVRAQQQAEQERLALQQQVIDAQQAALRELSTPLIPVADDVVVMPLIGTLDSRRAQDVMETLLQGIAEHQAEYAILDVTGVKVVDTQVAQALVRVAQAAKLLGTHVILTGIGSEIALTLVQLGADLTGIITRSTLQRGIAYARGER